MPRRACSKDANQDELAETFHRLGWQVIDTHEVAQYIPGFPDMLVVRWPWTLYVEVKTEGEDLNANERAFHQTLDAPVEVCRTVDDVLAVHEIWSRRGMIDA